MSLSTHTLRVLVVAAVAALSLAAGAANISAGVNEGEAGHGPMISAYQPDAAMLHAVATHLCE